MVPVGIAMMVKVVTRIHGVTEMVNGMDPSLIMAMPKDWLSIQVDRSRAANAPREWKPNNREIRWMILEL